MLRRLWLVLSLLWLAFFIFAAFSGSMGDEDRAIILGIGTIPWMIKWVALWIVRGNERISSFLLK